MRIIAGTHRGRKVIGHDQSGIRPTKDRVRESVFASLKNLIPQSRFLDLYTGTGAIAFEAKSRGSTQVVAVDQDSSAIDIVNKNSQNLNLNIQSIHSDAMEFLLTTNYQFDIIYIDPPYRYDLTKLTKVLSAIVTEKIITNSGLIIVESSEQTNLSTLKGLKIRKLRKFGKTKVVEYLVQ